MEEHIENEAIATFDTLYTSNQIQMLKILLPYIDAQTRKKLVILIKLMELQFTFDYCSRNPAALLAADCTGEAKKPDIIELFSQLKNFCSPTQRAMFEQFANMKKSMEMYEQMMEMMQMFNQMSPEGAASPGFGGMGGLEGMMGGSNPLDMLKGMLSPEQQAMFEMFRSA